MKTGSKSESSPTDFLLIGGGFFGYADEISAELERRGRVVTRFEDRPSTDAVTKAMVRLAPGIVAARGEAYFDAIIKRIRGQPIRDVLVIKGESLSVAAIRRMRTALPKARFTIYFWDSYLNMPADSRAKVSLFDRAFSFDPVDAAADAALIYRPLFYLDEYAHLPPSKNDIDLLFFGTAHTDRYAVLRRLQRALSPSVKFEKVLYLPSHAIYWARRIFDPTFWTTRQNEFIFKPIGKAGIKSLMARARVVVDIERAAQTGLTMRTLETLGAGKKLITTNAAIRQADFFDPNNIVVIDRQRPVLPEDFLCSPYVPPQPDLLERYSLSGWLDVVVGGCGEGRASDTD